MDKNLTKDIAEVFEKPRYRFKDGHTGTVRWERDSAVGYGIMTTDNGQQFTVARHEVEKL